MKTIRALGVAALASLSLTGWASAQQIPAPGTPSPAEDIQNALTGGVPNGRWKEGLMFEGISPQPWLTSAANWFPGSEEVQPEEMRITFMGTAPILRPGQANTSVFVELGNGDNFIFDIGEGSVANYQAARIALNELTNVFITHLHVDHFGALPYLWMFRTWSGGVARAAAHPRPFRSHTGIRNRGHGRRHEDDDRLAPRCL